jgi:tetratricopeptide (TPR) repeat protein
MKNLILFIAFLIPALHSQALDKKKVFEAAEKNYKANQFDLAIKQYESILKTGEVSVALYYNLGNAYYKRGDWGKAILNYERALKRNPGDEDVKINLKFANSKITDKINSETKGIGNWFLRVINLQPADVWSKLAVYLLLMSFALITLKYFITKYKTHAFVFGIIGASVGFIFAIFGYAQYYWLTSENKAVVITPSVEIKGSPADNSKTLFLLHEGAKINVHDSNPQWLEISIDNEKMGWVKKTDAEII